MLDALIEFLAGVRRRCDQLVADPALDRGQGALLAGFLARVRAKKIGVLADPVALVYQIARAEGAAIDTRAEDLAAGCSLYYLALRLFDDVADGELAPPYAEAGPHVASHGALTLYTLALDAIHEAAPAAAAPAIRRALRRHSLRASAAQHRDLVGAIQPDEAGVLAHNGDKSSVFALIPELAALASGCDDARADAYRRVGEATCTMRQIANDLRDIFGKRESGDLARGVTTLPLACFAARASEDQRAELARLRAALPGSLEPIRRLLLASPAIQACAAAMEAARARVHRELLALAGPATPLDLHRAFVDAMAAELYRAPPIEPAPIYPSA